MAEVACAPVYRAPATVRRTTVISTPTYVYRSPSVVISSPAVYYGSYYYGSAGTSDPKVVWIIVGSILAFIFLIVILSVCCSRRSGVDRDIYIDEIAEPHQVTIVETTSYYPQQHPDYPPPMYPPSYS